MLKMVRKSVSSSDLTKLYQLVYNTQPTAHLATNTQPIDNYGQTYGNC